MPMPLDPFVDDSNNRRLWIGNLDPRVTDYCNFFFYWFVLLKLLQQHGAIEKFDLLFHRSGPLEGQPRGYAFVTYVQTEFAESAQKKLDGKYLGSKKLSVKWACTLTKEPVIEKQKPILNIPALAGTKDTKKVSKTSTIQAIEAKLKTMEEASSSFYLELDKKPSNLQKRKYSPCNKSNYSIKESIGL
ncbi:conserved hypothetical protein [Pediculus humanus corporis]|uniref:Probable RNA-binding protein 18 n=1 Tax=Pediculus humanus subsp. corporis TaxID=121224 RepID=E0VEN8_PEDHC|nr:uncharacterized protein Phum_PHUM137040 [Pediculus humanus corporis]EEB11844.1 conserved hypothetical protein [Pediculus humanus corporis]